VTENLTVGYSADSHRSLAYIEMRVLMAKFLYNFTFELADPNYDWVSTKRAYGAWNNSGLKLRLKKIVD
jgi:cytochrome P450